LVCLLKVSRGFHDIKKSFDEQGDNLL
jgi:hypothetical protein